MANLVEILFRAGGAAQVTSETQKVQSGLGNLNTGVKSFLGGMKSLDSTMASLGLGLGLMSLVQSTERWVSEAVAGAAVEARLTRTFTNIAGGAANATAMLAAMTTATKNQVAGDELMATGMDVINLGLAKTPAQMEQYIAVSKRLGAEFGAMGFDEAVSGFNRMMEAGSVSARFLLNYGISADNVKARIVGLQQANSNLSDSDAARQAIMAEAVATYEKLGPVQRDTIAAQNELATSSKDFQDAFGAMLLSVGGSTGIFDTATAAMRRLQQGAEAWQGVMQAGGMATVQDSIAAQYKTWEDYERAQRAARNSMMLTRDEFAVLQGKMAGVSSDVGVFNTKLTSTAGASATAKAAATGYTGALRTLALSQDDVNKKLDEYRSKMAFGGSPYTAAIAQANQLDSAWGVILGKSAAYRNELMAQSYATGPYVGGVTTANYQAQIDAEKATAQERERATEEAGRKQQEAVKSAADALRSTIESVMKPTLDEVWKPPEGAEARIDEDARRLAAVAMRGFGEKGWLDKLTAEYGGMSFWQPILDAMGKGDEGALKAAATSILTSQAPMLWDVPTIVEKVKASLADQDARTQIMNAVMAQLSGEGIQVNAGEVGAAMGGGGMAGIAGPIAGGLAGGLPAALGEANVGGTMLTAITGTLAANKKEMAALASALARGLNDYLPAAMGTSGQVFLDSLTAYVMSKLGVKPGVAGGARP